MISAQNKQSPSQNIPYQTMLEKREEILTGQKLTPEQKQLKVLETQLDTFAAQLNALNTELKTL